MRRSTYGLLLALAPASLFARSPTPAGDLPCGAVSASLPPCDAPGKPVAAVESGESLRARRAGLEAAVRGARRAALEAEIDGTLLELEAARRKTTLAKLLEDEVLRRAPEPSEAEILAAYEQGKKRGDTKPLEASRPALEREARDRARARRETEFARSLRERFKVTMGSDPNAPSLPRDAVLATVGGRKITAASAATRLDATAFGVRRNLPAEGSSAVTPEAPALQLDSSLGASRGRDDAAVTVVEWADFECGHCARTWDTLEEALKPYGQSVRLVFLNYPLPAHEFAEKAAEAAAAARAQGRFFEYAELLFRNQRALDVPSLKKYAALAGLDPERFGRDLDGGRFAGEVFLEKRSGVRAGVFGTPSLFVNGVFLPWDRLSLAEIRAAVDRALARAAPEASR